MRPIVVVNFKAYPQVEGDGSLALARAMERVSESSGVRMVAVPPVLETSRVASDTSVEVWTQHVNARSPGSATGWVTATMASASGAMGTLLNHTEHGMRLNDIERAVISCRDAGLTTCVCTASAASSGAAAFLGPDFVAVEPPELIGGDVSVTSARPEVVSDAVDAVRRVSNDVVLLCGAGVKDGGDVRAALDLGAGGVLLASGVVKSKDPAAVLEDLVSRI